MQIIFNYTFPVSLNSVKDWMADNCLQLSSDRSSNFCPGWHCPKRDRKFWLFVKPSLCNLGVLNEADLES